MSESKVTSFEPMNGGINNQKMALMGLFAIAKDRGAAVCLPEIVDFTPGVFEPNRRRFDKVFNFDTLKFYFGSTSESHPSEIISASTAFQRGAELIHGIARQDVSSAILACRLLKSLSPMEAVLSAVACVQTIDIGAVVQLRVEKDWIHYAATRLAQRASSYELTSTDPMDILKRIVNSGVVEGDKAVYLCLDERNIDFDINDLKSWSQTSFNIELVLKSDLLRDRSLLNSNANASLVDFHVAALADIFVGTSRSTFSNLVALRAAIDSSPSRKDFIYNLQSGVVARFDAGVEAEPGAAATNQYRHWLLQILTNDTNSMF